MFEKGVANFTGRGEPIKAVRIRATEKHDHPLVVREIVLDSRPRFNSATAVNRGQSKTS